MGLIKIILTILFIYYAFKFVIRLFGPMLMKKAVSKMQEKAAEKFGGQKQAPNVRDGETIIDKKPQKSKQSNDSVGDYVDFEEIE